MDPCFVIVNPYAFIDLGLKYKVRANEDTVDVEKYRQPSSSRALGLEVMK